MHIQGSQPCQHCFDPFFGKGVYSKRKEFAPSGSKFFLLRVEPAPEKDQCAGMPTGSHKSCLSCKMEDHLPSTSMRLKSHICVCLEDTNA